MEPVKFEIRSRSHGRWVTTEYKTLDEALKLFDMVVHIHARCDESRHFTELVAIENNATIQLKENRT